MLYGRQASRATSPSNALKLSQESLSFTYTHPALHNLPTLEHEEAKTLKLIYFD